MKKLLTLVALLVVTSSVFGCCGNKHHACKSCHKNTKQTMMTEDYE